MRRPDGGQLSVELRMTGQNKGAAQNKRLPKIVTRVAVLCGLVVFGCVSFPYAFIAYLKLASVINIWTAENDSVNWVLSHAYPNSTMDRADTSVSFWPVGNHATVAILVTFESADSFEAIKDWYIQHPEG